jgi:hypothetical protein
MKVKDLIEALQKMDGNLEVYGVSDHGQMPEKAQAPSVIYMETLDNSLEEFSHDMYYAAEWGWESKAVLL